MDINNTFPIDQTEMIPEEKSSHTSQTKDYSIRHVETAKHNSVVLSSKMKNMSSKKRGKRGKGKVKLAQLAANSTAASSQLAPEETKPLVSLESEAQIYSGVAVESQSHTIGWIGGEDTKPVQNTLKRTMDDKTAERDEKKRSRIEEPPKMPARYYSQQYDASNIVAITLKQTDYLPRVHSYQVIKILEEKILRLACEEPTGSIGPQFKGKPTYKGYILTLWCADAQTISWLKKTVEAIILPSGERFTTKLLSELKRMVYSGIVLPAAIYEPDVITKTLRIQNQWACVHRWIFHDTKEQDQKSFLLVSIPEDIIKVLIKHERRLSFFFGSVYVMFQGKDKKFSNVPPGLNLNGEDEDHSSSLMNNDSYTSEPEASSKSLNGMPNSSDEYTYENLESPDESDWEYWPEEE